MRLEYEKTLSLSVFIDSSTGVPPLIERSSVLDSGIYYPPPLGLSGDLFMTAHHHHRAINIT
jgi:hypothetical protein